MKYFLHCETFLVISSSALILKLVAGQSSGSEEVLKLVEGLLVDDGSVDYEDYVAATCNDPMGWPISEPEVDPESETDGLLKSTVKTFLTSKSKVTSTIKNEKKSTTKLEINSTVTTVASILNTEHEIVKTNLMENDSTENNSTENISTGANSSVPDAPITSENFTDIIGISEQNSKFPIDSGGVSWKITILVAFAMTILTVNGVIYYHIKTLESQPIV